MWTQSYAPLGGSIALSALAAALPLAALAYLLALRRLPSHVAAPASLGVAVVVAVAVYGAPARIVASAGLMGAAFGLFPITWIVLNALFVYNLAVVTGRFAVIRDSIAALAQDRRIQALLVAFSFGTLMESVAGFGTPVALGGAMLVGLGFAAERAILLALLANTSAVAFGNLGIPIVSLAGVVAPLLGERRETLEAALSATVGRQVSVLSLVIPALLVLLVGGWRALREVWPAALAAGAAFASTQLVVASLLGPALAGVLASLASFGALVALLQVWQPARTLQPAYYSQVAEAVEALTEPLADQEASPPLAEAPLTGRVVLDAWTPLLALVVAVVLGSLPPVSRALDAATLRVAWPGLSGAVLKAPPLLSPVEAGTAAAVYPAVYVFDWLRAAGTLALLAGIVAVALLGVPAGRALQLYWHTVVHLRRPALAICSFLALAWVMNYGGLTGSLGLLFTLTGPLLPFFSAFLGWLGVFLTGSDTASNNLFGGLQVTAAKGAGVSPILAAATNSSGGTCGKLISPQNLAIGTAAVGLPGAEGQVLRRALPWSVGLASAVGLLALLQAYVLPG